MLELGQLERRSQDFANRYTRVVAVSMEGLEDAAKTQAQFPHLLVIADQERGLSNAVAVIHPGAAPDGGDSDAPTTILVDRQGTVRWLYRPAAALSRLSPDEVLQAVDQHLSGAQGQATLPHSNPIR
jgi:alkyl hydroperoxide reductase subunit AhpC